MNLPLSIRYYDGLLRCYDGLFLSRDPRLLWREFTQMTMVTNMFNPSYNHVAVHKKKVIIMWLNHLWPIWLYLLFRHPSGPSTFHISLVWFKSSTEGIRLTCWIWNLVQDLWLVLSICFSLQHKLFCLICRALWFSIVSGRAWALLKRFKPTPL